MKTRILFFIIGLVFFSCEKQDEVEVLNGGVIKQFELVQIERSQLPQQDSYDGKIGNIPITAQKVDENKLAFLVNEQVNLGENILEIPSLNLKVKYEVKAVELGNTVDNTIASFIQNFDEFSTGLGNSQDELYVSNSISNISSAIHQMSEEDREVIAKVYSANKSYFDNLYNIDYTQPQARPFNNNTLTDFSNLTNIQLAKNFVLATLGAGLATAGAVMGAPNALICVPFALAAIPLWLVTKDLLKEIVVNRVWRYTQAKFDELVSSFEQQNRQQTLSNQLQFISDANKTVNFSLNKRGFTNSDANTPDSGNKLFFNAFNKFNQIIEDLNDAITLINTLPLINEPLLNLETLGVPNSNTLSANANLLNKMSFSIDNSNLQLTAPTIANNLTNLKIKILNTQNVTDYVDANLNYTINDEFNSLKGSIPIRVLKNEQPILTNISFTNPSTSNSCGTGSYISKAYSVVYTFTGVSPVGGKIFIQTCWSPTVAPQTGCTPNYEIDILTGSVISNGNTHQFTVPGIVFCWGTPQTSLNHSAYFVSPTGNVGNTITRAVPQ